MRWGWASDAFFETLKALNDALSVLSWSPEGLSSSLRRHNKHPQHLKDLESRIYPLAAADCLRYPRFCFDRWISGSYGVCLCPVYCLRRKAKGEALQESEIRYTRVSRFLASILGYATLRFAPTRDLR